MGTDGDGEKSTSKMIDVLIVGAGIGCHVSALCLHRARYSVRVYERGCPHCNHSL